MSITSSHYQERDPDFAALLTRYPGLAGWLSDILQGTEETRAEDLLPRFLAECASQDVPGDAYPFTAEGWGLPGLRAYLRAARAEIEAFMTAETPRKPALEPASAPSEAEPASIPSEPASAQDAETPAQPAHAAVADLETMEVPAVPPEKQDGAETPEPAHAAVADLETVEVSAVSPEQPQDVQTNAVPPEPETAQEAETPEPARAEVADPETVEVPAVSPEKLDGAMGAETRAEEGEQTPMVAPLDTRGGIFRRKRKRARRPRTRRQRILSWALLLLILAAILVPGALLVNFGLSAYNTYHELSNQAHTAFNQLLDVKTVFSSGGGSRLSGLFDLTKLHKAQQDFRAAGHDFQQLQQELRQSSTLKTVTTYFPQYRAAVSSALAASAMGIDVANVGLIATANAIQLAPNLNGPLLAASSKPLVTQSMLDTVGTTIDQVQPLLNDIQAQAQQISLDSLPLSASEKAQLGQLLPLLPQAIKDLNTARGLLGDVGWLLGVNHPRTFLVQTMDRAELRATGGFTGQLGELTINGGRVAPFSLTDIGQIEYTPTSANQGQMAPEQYRSWWPYANFGLRDSNISADFPTTAQLAISLYKDETGHSVDGVISFTPVVIEHILAIMGPITVPGYNTTVTAQNLEDVLHYYQLDNGGILKQKLVNGNNADRKSFTSLVASLLMTKVRSAPPSELLPIAQQVLNDLKSRDLQVYFTDPSAEQTLMRYGYAGQLDRSTTHDGFYVVQENLSASKASQYVQTSLHDTVTLDSQGGATHVLQIRLVYNQAGPVYGYDTYNDYLRVYVPTSSKLISGDGFASGQPLCGGNYGSCPVNGAYPGGELSCPAGQYQPGQTTPWQATTAQPNGSDGATWMPLQTIGGPTNTTSDEPGRAMYGGWVMVPKNCTMNVTLSWYVPPMSRHGYSLLVQRQAGTYPELDLTIVPDAADCARLGTAGLHFDGILLKDTSFTPPAVKTTGQGCYPRAGA